MIEGDGLLPGSSFEEWWVVRPKNGGTLGENNVKKYLTDIGRWYEMGNRERNKTVSVAQMRSALELMYSDRNDIPTGQQITNSIN